MFNIKGDTTVLEIVDAMIREPLSEAVRIYSGYSNINEHARSNINYFMVSFGESMAKVKLRVVLDEYDYQKGRN